MVVRIVKCSQKDSKGNIISVGHKGEPWSPRASELVISDIEGKSYEYYVNSTGGPKVIVVVASSGKHLRSTADAKDSNNLDNLPDC